MIAPANAGGRPRFYRYSIAEIAARPSPRVLVANAIESANLIAAAGDIRFWQSAAAILGDGVLLLEDRDGRLRTRSALMRKAIALRRSLPAHVAPAVIIYCGRNGENWAWFAGVASVVAEAFSPTAARVIKLRAHINWNNVLRIRKGKLVLEAATPPFPS